ncbi:hypothetical protein HKD37_14G040525 [Glycine soja]
MCLSHFVHVLHALHDVSSIRACRPRIFCINGFLCFLEDEWQRNEESKRERRRHFKEKMSLEEAHHHRRPWIRAWRKKEMNKGRGREEHEMPRIFFINGFLCFLEDEWQRNGERKRERRRHFKEKMSLEEAHHHRRPWIRAWRKKEMNKGKGREEHEILCSKRALKSEVNIQMIKVEKNAHT